MIRKLPRQRGEEAAQAIARARAMPWWSSVLSPRPVNSGGVWWVWRCR